MTTTIISLTLILIGILGSFFLAFMENILFSLKKSDIKMLTRVDNKNVKWLASKLHSLGRLSLFFVMSKVFFNILMLSALYLLMRNSFIGRIALAPVRYLTYGALMWVFLLLFGYIFPTIEGPNDKFGKIQRYSGLLRVLYKLLSPISSLLHHFLQFSRKKSYKSYPYKSIENELKALSNINGEKPSLNPREKEMIRHITGFRSTLVREVMVPRIDVVAIEVTTPPEKVIELVNECGHSRIPVYEEKIDNIVGILYAKDILRYTDSLDEFDLREAVREAYFVPEAKKINTLLKELRKNRIHIAVVVDEFGGVAGIVTLEDIIEEIIGEIEDEYDDEEVIIYQIDENIYNIKAKIPLNELNERLGLNLPTDTADTLGGFLYHLCGSIPQQGEQINYGNLLFAIEKVSKRRISIVKLVKKEEAEAGEESEEE